MTEVRPLALAHRGARLQAPENTVSAFELALEHGCDGFECDLRATAEGEIVLCHDSAFLGSKVLSSHYAELAEKAEVRALEKPPLLKDVLSRFARRAYINLELKVAGMAAEVAMLLAVTAPSEILISSFLPEALNEMRGSGLAAKLAWICRSAHKLPAWRQIDCDAVVLHFSLARRETIETMHAAGKQVLVWAAEREREMQWLLEAGVVGIISDHTELLVETLSRTKARAAVLGR